MTETTVDPATDDRAWYLIFSIKAVRTTYGAAFANAEAIHSEPVDDDDDGSEGDDIDGLMGAFPVAFAALPAAINAIDEALTAVEAGNDHQLQCNR